MLRYLCALVYKPYISRHHVKALVELIILNDWRRISVCHEDTFWGNSTGLAFIEELDSHPGFEAAVLNRGATEYTVDEMTSNPVEALTRLQRTGAKIFFLVAGSRVQRHMFAAMQQETLLLGRGYAWLLPYQTVSAFTENDGSMNADAIKGAAGSISTRDRSMPVSSERYEAVVSQYTAHWQRRSNVGGCSRETHVVSKQGVQYDPSGSAFNFLFGQRGVNNVPTGPLCDHMSVGIVAGLEQQQRVVYCDVDGRPTTFSGYSRNAIDAVSISLAAFDALDNEAQASRRSQLVPARDIIDNSTFVNSSRSRTALHSRLYQKMKLVGGFQGVSGLVHFDDYGDMKGDVQISNLQINILGCGVDFVNVGNYASNEGALTMSASSTIVYPGGVETVPKDRDPINSSRESISAEHTAGIVVGVVLFMVLFFLVVQNNLKERKLVRNLKTKLDAPIDFVAHLRDMIAKGEISSNIASSGVKQYFGIPREIEREAMAMVGRVGSGSFGEIWEGTIDESAQGGTLEYTVACKICLDPDKTDELIVEAAVCCVQL